MFEKEWPGCFKRPGVDLELAASITYAMAIANRFGDTGEPASYYNNRGIVGWGPHDNIVVRNCYVHDACASGIRWR